MRSEAGNRTILKFSVLLGRRELKWVSGLFEITAAPRIVFPLELNRVAKSLRTDAMGETKSAVLSSRRKINSITGKDEL